MITNAPNPTRSTPNTTARKRWSGSPPGARTPSRSRKRTYRLHICHESNEKEAEHHHYDGDDDVSGAAHTRG